MRSFLIVFLFLSTPAFAWVVPVGSGATQVSGGFIGGAAETAVASVGSDGVARSVVSMGFRVGTPAGQAALSVADAYTISSGMRASMLGTLAAGGRFLPGVGTILTLATVGQIGYEAYQYAKAHSTAPMSCSDIVSLYNSNSGGNPRYTLSSPNIMSSSSYIDASGHTQWTTPGAIATCSAQQLSAPSIADPTAPGFADPLLAPTIPANVAADIANVYAEQAKANNQAPIPNGFPSYGLNPAQIYANPAASPITITPPAVSGNPYMVSDPLNTPAPGTNPSPSPSPSPSPAPAPSPTPAPSPYSPAVAVPTPASNGQPAGWQLPAFALDTTAQATNTALNTTGAQAVDSEQQDISNLTSDSGSLPTFAQGNLTGNVPLPSSNGSACSPINVSFNGIPWVLDDCPVQSYLHPLINYMAVFMFGVLALRTAFSKGEI